LTARISLSTSRRAWADCPAAAAALLTVALASDSARALI
jgi:hypothetical protein